jgi:hypothetical protein
MLELNYAAEMARLQHEDRLQQAEKARRYRELRMAQTGWLNWWRNHLIRNR